MKILFLCIHNSARSQIAEALGREIDLEGRHQWHSAGTEPSTVHPRAVAVLRERAIDGRQLKSKRIEDVPQDPDIVVTLCGEAEEACPAFPGNPRRLHWPLPDPSRFTGTEQELRCSWAEVRDEIERRITKLLGEIR